jgi:hypothetical protein
MRTHQPTNHKDSRQENDFLLKCIRRLFHFFQCNWGAIPFKEKKKQRQTSEAKKKNHRKERELQSPAHTSPKLPVFSTIMKKKEQEFSMTKSIIQEFTFPNFLQDLNI